MPGRSQILRAWLPFLVDAALLAVSLRLAYWLRFESGVFAAPKGVPPLGVHLPAFAFLLGVQLLSLHAFGLYRVRSGRPLSEELWRVFLAVTAGTFVGMAATFLYREVSFSRLLFFQGWLLSCALVMAGRWTLRRASVAAQRSGWGTSRVAVVGWGPIARTLYREVNERPSLGYRLVGWVGDAADREGPEGAPFLGRIEDLRHLCRTLGIEGLLVTLPAEGHARMADIIRQVDGQGVEVRFVPDWVELMSRSAGVSDIGGIPLIGLREFPMRPVDRVVKRTLDIVISAVGLVVLSPFLAALAVLVRLDSPGPVIYRQRRVGRDGRSFVIYKFRSMRGDAEEGTGPVWAHDGDDRVTRVGRHLRRLSLDELPQLLNVLRGEMSLVGPRPEREFFIRRFETAVPRYLDRHRVKSGMTGWAQVHGMRGNTPIDERTEYDIYYVENWSVALDLKVLWRTFLHLLGKGSAGTRGRARGALEIPGLPAGENRGTVPRKPGPGRSGETQPTEQGGKR